MNPLSSFTFASRHKRLIVMLTAIMALTVAGLYLFIGLAQKTYIEPAFVINRYLTKFNLVMPDQAPSLDPDSINRIFANPDVAHVLPQAHLAIKVANIGGANFLFRLIPLHAPDFGTVLSQSGVTLTEGRLPEAGTNEVALSEEIAAALKLSIGDTFGRTTDEKAYPNILSPLKLTGILSGEVRLGLLSLEYMEQSETYSSEVDGGLLVIAKPGREAAVESFLLQSIRNSATKTYTYQSVSEQTAKDQNLLYVLGIPIVLLVSFAITMVIGAVNQLVFNRRLAEFGTLYAIGYRRSWLAGRMTLETAGPAICGWIAGILLGWGGIAVVNAAAFTPQGFGTGGGSLMALLFTALVPIVVTGSALRSAFRALGRLDAVAVVERGQLTMEAGRSSSAGNPSAQEQPRPLAPLTYYRRHKRQAWVLTGSTLLLILGTGLLFFLFAAGADAIQPELNNLSRMSAVSPNNGPLDPALVESIRANPAVERVMNVYAFSPLKISIPPMFPDQPIDALCVTAGDMQYLIALYGLKLAEGRLPAAGTNEVVIPWAAAKNRNLNIGDVIGDPANPAYPGAPSLPIQIVVSGIFAPGGTLAQETWFSFMSLEYVEQFRESALSLIIIPRAGQKAALDDWLDTQAAGENQIVLTHKNQQAAQQKEMGSMLFTFSLMEGVIALVAALALAGLHYLFLEGRESELGTLQALGFRRRQLIRRILGELLFTICAAWLAGMAACLAVLLFLQYGLFGSIGLKLNLFNPAPWLATQPIPAAVLTAGAILTAWMLSRLDPVSIIERREAP
jgi:ABC-type antimicrobial peptide transport system permease subunit